MSSFPRGGTFTGGDVSSATHFLSSVEIDGNVGFYGTDPVAKPAAYTLTWGSLARLLPNTAAVAPASTAATNVTPFGYTTQAQADAIRAASANMVSDLGNVKNVLAQLITDLRTAGLIA